MHLHVHVGLLLIPLQTSTMIKKNRLWDNHGFPVHPAFEAYNFLFPPLCMSEQTFFFFSLAEGHSFPV